MNNFSKYILLFAVIGLFAAGTAYAFVGPSTGQTPGTGGGLFNVDSNRNIGFGTETPTPTDAFDATSTQSGSTAHGHTFIVASTTNPGIGILNQSSGIKYLWAARNFGPLQLYREGGGNQGKVIFDIDALGKVGISYPSFYIPAGVRLRVGDGDIQAPGFRGSGVNLTSIDPQSFIAGSAFASGNYAVDGALAIGSSTVVGLPTNGLYVHGNVGIGTASPVAELDINGDLHMVRSDGTAYIQFGTDSGSQYNEGQIAYNNSTNIMSFRSGDVTNLYIKSGNVGIGTSDPDSPLHVNGQLRWGGDAEPYVYSNEDGNGLYIEQKGTTASDEDIRIQSSKAGDAANYAQFFIDPTDGFSFMSTGTGNGKVGIGTASPGSPLDVKTPSSVTEDPIARFIAGDGRTLQLLQPDNNADGDPFTWKTNNAYTWRVDDADALLIDQIGRVGVGMAPQYTFDVNGSGRFSGTLTVATPTADAHAATKAYVDSSIAGGGGSTVGYWTQSSTNIYNSNTGNVGIGTSSPGGKLEVHGTGEVASIISTNSSTEDPVLIFKEGVNQRGDIRFDTSAGVLRIYAYQQISFNPSYNAVPLMYLDTYGNVGIGTTSPAAVLGVVGGGSFSQPVTVGAPTASSHAATKSYVDSALTGGDNDWAGVGGNPTLAGDIYHTGDVGIGTTSPGAKLEIKQDSASMLRLNRSGTSAEGGLTFADNGTVKWYFYQNDGGNDLNIQQTGVSGEGDTTPRMRLSGSTKDVLLALSGGNVGVGSASPAYNLEVQSTADAAIYLESDTASGSEDRNSFVKFSQDAGGVQAIIGTVGNAGNDPESVPYIGTLTNSTLFGTLDGNGALHFGTNDNVRMTIETSGDVGIATNGPAYKFETVGTGRFSSTVVVGTPTGTSHATTKSYVDTALGSYLLKSGGTMTGNINMDSNNISGVNKLTVTTIDPVFEIEGGQYATYMADNIGVEVQEAGIFNLGRYDIIGSSAVYKYVVDFDNLKKGSDLWLFANTVDWGDRMKNLTVILTPDFSGNVWYEKDSERNRIIVFGRSDDIRKSEVEVSYRLLAPRIDKDKWGNEPEESIKKPIKVSEYRKSEN